MIKEMTVHELKKLQDDNIEFVLLDVREQSEYDVCNLGGHLIPLRELPQHIKEFDPQTLTVVHCKSGGQSSRAVEYLQQHGFEKVFNLKGGLQAWAEEIGL